jgi:hypothetical protein
MQKNHFTAEAQRKGISADAFLASFAPQRLGSKKPNVVSSKNSARQLSCREQYEMFRVDIV